MKKFKRVRNIVAIIMVTAMATAVFAGCSTANDERKESAVVSIVEEESKESSVESEETSVEESEESSEVSVEESSKESVEVSVQESSEETEVESEVESSVVSEEDGESSKVEESVNSSTESSEEQLQSASIDDAIGYIQLTTPYRVSYNNVGAIFTPGDIFYLLKEDDTFVYFYYDGYSFKAPKNKFDIITDESLVDPTHLNYDNLLT